MVVTTTPVYDATLPSMVMRIRNVTSNSFDIRVDRADGQSGTVPGISVDYLAAEEGTYNAASHDITMEAHKHLSTVTDSAGNWVAEKLTLSNNYSNPVVLGQVISYNDPRFSVFWSRGAKTRDPATAANFWIGKHTGEDPDSTRLDETIGYIVIESGTGQVIEFNYLATRGTDTISGLQNGSFQYNISGINTPVSVVATQTGMDGVNGGCAVLTGSTSLTTTSFNLAIDEDQVKDNERSHTSEQVDYIVFEKIF